MKKFFAFAVLPATMVGLLAYQNHFMAQAKPVEKSEIKLVEEVAKPEIDGVKKQNLDFEEIKQVLETKLQGIAISDISQSPYENMVEVYVDGEILYATKDGGFLIFSGQMIGMQGARPENLTQKSMAEWNQRQAPKRAKMIADIPETDMVIFPAKDEKHVVTVFTDVDCGYCRKMHTEMSQYNDAGITVRYMAYPRAGLNSDSYNKLQAIWCADNRNDMMTRAKARQEITMKTCENPIKQHMQLVGEFGLSGTPAVIAPDGNIIGGYVEAQRLKQYLDSMAMNKS